MKIVISACNYFFLTAVVLRSNKMGTVLKNSESSNVLSTQLTKSNITSTARTSKLYPPNYPNNLETKIYQPLPVKKISMIKDWLYCTMDIRY